MILHQNSIIQLTYNPAADILEVRYPDLYTSFLSEARENLKLMVEAIHNYDVKNLLLDASTTAIEVSPEESRELTMQLAKELAQTRLRKVARIQPQDPTKEIRAQENIRQLERGIILPYQLRTFADRAAALKWLAS